MSARSGYGKRTRETRLEESFVVVDAVNQIKWNLAYIIDITISAGWILVSTQTVWKYCLVRAGNASWVGDYTSIHRVSGQRFAAQWSVTFVASTEKNACFAPHRHIRMQEICRSRAFLNIDPSIYQRLISFAVCVLDDPPVTRVRQLNAKER